MSAPNAIIGQIKSSLGLSFEFAIVPPLEPSPSGDSNSKCRVILGPTTSEAPPKVEEPPAKIHRHLGPTNHVVVI